MAPDWLTDRPVSHRGLHNIQAGVPENTLAAIEASCQAGLPTEIDVRLLADGTVVVHHDLDSSRLSGDARPLSTLRQEDLAGIRLGGTNEGIPTLDQTLELVAGRIPLLIEIKNERHHAGPLEQAVYEQIRHYQGDHAVISFNPASLIWFARRHPHILRGQTATHLPRLRLNHMAPLHAGLRHFAFNKLSKPNFVIFDHRGLTLRGPRRARRSGLPLIAYTVSSEAERKAALKHADNVIFEGFSLAKSSW